MSHKIKADIKKAYDAIAPKYLTWTENTHTVRLSYLQKLLANLNLNTEEGSNSILELGCGAGVPVTQHLTTVPNTRITANDISETQIALARERLPASVTLIQGDMMGLSFADESFAAVLAMYSIFHLPRDEQVTMLERVYGWLKPGGWVLANFSAGEFESVSNETWLGGREGVVHWSGWGVDGTRQVLRDVGFVIEVDEVRADEEGEEDGSVKKVEFYWVLARK
ncbi:putative O-methyltransferase [Penicillium brasilianum]|uniref:Putative O-methyltransferase n=1 Tax=Penicillium brasilianum TaxID=104259 RepID=A0A1S9RMG3_PENBI|nr:putative O-methyltransferase [Penicillium brasilianum]